MLQDLQGGIQRQRCRPQNMAFPVGGYAAVTGDEVVEKGQFQYLWCNSGKTASGGNNDLNSGIGGTGQRLSLIHIFNRILGISKAKTCFFSIKRGRGFASRGCLWYNDNRNRMKQRGGKGYDPCLLYTSRCV